jgi:hypothetical protein
MVLPCRVDQHGIQVDTDDVVADRRQMAAHPAGAAAGIEDPRGPRHHGIDQTRLAGQIGALRGHVPEPLDVPL